MLKYAIVNSTFRVFSFSVCKTKFIFMVIVEIHAVMGAHWFMFTV